MTRLEPLPADSWDDTVRDALRSLLPAERANPRDAGNVLATMVRHPALTRAYLPFNAYLLTGSTLSPRDREIALLRAVLKSDCDYLWSHHLPIAERAGLTAEEIDTVRSGQPAGKSDAAVVHAADELVDSRTISAAVWDELGQHFTEEQRMDLVFTIGGYCLLAMAVNAFGVQKETT
ncbi:carboxymuconolactone decarboxylase [Mycolicibacter terrae]|uniref:Carboxymuconolactone decarboxylase n=1 Tax=Mycolicibacter terrae TaxID=1788 RepID=A0AAD1HZN3_9MYCO|nr:carboxymuconolactone decarboxylase family protein [Mycolicibacter terrae]ORW90741.1 carboxymuconolactone decarboxylase [Mycolicibacter terrae]BBX21121.1 carboxymuconolactone decarboxylase [Mycolicibacter terrae]SNV91663.1 carboxymuconolactone decarboxylase [Mycolicibacter terrae]